MYIDGFCFGRIISVFTFSFKLCAAWSDRQENYILAYTKNNKYNLHAFPLYFNKIISYSFMIAPGEKRVGLVQLYSPEHCHLELMKQYIYLIIPLAVQALSPPTL